MAAENPIKKLQTLGKTYDSFYASLKDANKVSDKSYGKFKHVRHCWTFFLDFLKAQNTIIRWIMLAFSFGVPLLIAYLKKEKVAIVDDIPTSAFYIAGAFVLLLLFWWMDRMTLMKVTEPEDALFHVGAYEKYRNKEYKRHHDYFQGEPLSFEELKKDVEEKIKEEKDDHKEDVEYYESTLREKDALLTKSLTELSDIRYLFNDYSIRHYKLEKIFQEVLVKITNLSRHSIRIDELDFHHYFTVHKIGSKEYQFLYAKHPHLHKVGIHYPKKGTSHLTKIEKSNTGYYAIKDRYIGFLVEVSQGEKWIVTLYPKSRPSLEVHSEADYDTLYIEDIISLWKSFIQIAVASNKNLDEPKEESQHVKEA